MSPFSWYHKRLCLKTFAGPFRYHKGVRMTSSCGSIVGVQQLGLLENNFMGLFYWHCVQVCQKRFAGPLYGSLHMGLLERTRGGTEDRGGGGGDGGDAERKGRRKRGRGQG